MIKKDMIDSFASKLEFSQSSNAKWDATVFQENNSGCWENLFYSTQPFYGFLNRYFVKATKNDDGTITSRMSSVRANLTLGKPFFQKCQKEIKKSRKLKGCWMPMNQLTAENCVDSMMSRPDSIFYDRTLQIKSDSSTPAQLSYFDEFQQISTGKYKTAQDEFYDMFHMELPMTFSDGSASMAASIK